MAMNDRAKGGGAVVGSGAPGWLLPLYLGGLVLVYVGERVLSGLEKGSGAVTALGVAAALGATLLRFAPRFRGGGERRAIERLLAGLSITGLLALVVYYATTEGGAARFGLSNMPSEKREHVLDLLRVLWIALVTVAVVPQVFAEAALRPMRNAERPESRRVRAAATAGAALALAAIYGCLFVYSASGITKKWDYSYFKTSRPGESTKKIAASLSEPIRVVAFFPDVNEVKTEVEQYLKELALASPKLKVEVRDRLLAPKLARELRANQDGVIVLAKGSSTYTLNLGTELNAARPKLKTLDRDFQEQLLKAVRSKKTVYLTVGHGELNDKARKNEDKGRAAEIVRLLLQKQNLTVKELGLSQGLGSAVPDDADAVMVLGPTEAFSPEEIATLGRYADGGGHLLLALDSDVTPVSNLVREVEAQRAAEGSGAAPPSAETAPSAAPPAEAPSSPAYLQALAGLVGLTYSGDILAHDQKFVRVRSNDSDKTRLITSSFSSHASVSTLSRNAPQAAVVVFGAGSLDKAPNASGKIDFTVRSMTGTFADKNRDYKLERDAEKTSVFNLGAAVSRPVAGGTAPPAPAQDAKDAKDAKKPSAPDAKEMRAFVLSDADAVSDLVMSNVVGNQVLFVDATRWLVGEEKFAGVVNNEEDVRIEHSKQQDLAWFYATIFGTPAVLLGAGLWLGRRSRRAGGAA